MTGITRRGLLGAATGAAGGLAAMPLRAQSSTQWNAYRTSGGDAPSAKGLTRIAEGVEKASNGAFKIRVHLEDRSRSAHPTSPTRCRTMSCNSATMVFFTAIFPSRESCACRC